MEDTEVEIFRQRAHQMIDYTAEYLRTIRTRKPCPDVKPGYLTSLIPDCAPEEADEWCDVMKDIERVIMPGMLHYQSPHYHGFFPFPTSHPSICADILSSVVNCNGAIWGSAPVCTELEVIVMDWLGKLLQLPEEFLTFSGGKGGGVIQVSASESTLLCMLAAKCCTINRQMKLLNGQINHLSSYVIWEKLVAYTSDQAHSSVERAGLLAGIQVRLLPSDDNCGLRGKVLDEAIAKDRADGRIPFMLIATLGTTSTLGFDDLMELGPIARREGLWMHIDAAYAGSAFICPEFRPLLNGVEFTDSFNFNPHKWLLVNFDCSTLWLKNRKKFIKSFIVHQPYLDNFHSEDKITDFRHWHIHLSRRFRSLKLWFVMRLFGAKQLREHIRMHVTYAKDFENLVKSDPRFEVVHPVVMGLVCFRLKTGNELTKNLYQRLLSERSLHLTPTTVKGKYLMRFVIGSPFIKSSDVIFAWNEIRSHADAILSQNGGNRLFGEQLSEFNH